MASAARSGAPNVTGISPHQGTPGTQITIRGENLGESQADLERLIICGTDCLPSAKWKSPSKIVARLGAAKRGIGDVILLTRSGGRGISNVQFRVLVEQVGPLQESSVWVDETRTVPGRSTIRNVPEIAESEDMLGLRIDTQRRLDPALLAKMFPDGSGNRRMENWSPAWYLLENHKYTPIAELRQGLKNLQRSIAREEETSKSLHKTNLNSLINCVEALNELNTKMEPKVKSFKGGPCPLTGTLAKQINDSKATADKLFKEVLSRKDRADAIRNALSVLTRYRFVFFLAESIEENMAKADYSTILNDYTRAKALYKDSEVGLFKEVMVVLDEKMDKLKHALRKKLMDTPSSFEEQSKLIKYLKILDPDSDPAWDCITSYHCWLSDALWKVQSKYHLLASESDKEPNEQGYHHATSSPDASDHATSLDFTLPSTSSANYKQALVTELLALLFEKLQSFWRLAQSYSNSEDESYREKQDDIDEMVLNTTNVGSWLLLNALVPSSLPESVRTQYKEQFIEWPNTAADDQIADLFFALKALRTCLRLPLENQFTRMHVQPLVELTTTIRLKCLGLVVEKCCDAITTLGSRENWKTDLVADQCRTQLPDLLETEINEDLFSRDRVRQMIIDLFIMVVLSFKDCYEQLLQLAGRKEDNPSQEHQTVAVVAASGTRATRLIAAPDTLSISSAGSELAMGASPTQLRRVSINPPVKGPPPAAGSSAHSVSPRKLLITISNVDYVLNHSLASIVRQLGENGVRMGDHIHKKCRQRFTTFRQQLIRHYIAIKLSTVSSLLESMDYAHVPEEEDASDYVKELLMCVVFIQAELRVMAPQFMRQILPAVAESATQEALRLLPEKMRDAHGGDQGRDSTERATQLVIDLTILEEAFAHLLSPSTKAALNRMRMEFRDSVDEESLRASTQTASSGLRIAVQSLHSHADDSSKEIEEVADV